MGSLSGHSEAYGTPAFLDQKTVAAAMGTASSQFGMVSWAQARAHGLRHHDIRRLRRSGAWGNPYPQVYSVRSLLAPTNTDRWFRTAIMAAQLALGPYSFAGGETAARLWGMQGLNPWDGRTVPSHWFWFPAAHSVTLHSWYATQSPGAVSSTTDLVFLCPLLWIRDTTAASWFCQTSLVTRRRGDPERRNRGRKGVCSTQLVAVAARPCKHVCARPMVAFPTLQHRFPASSMIGIVDSGGRTAGTGPTVSARQYSQALAQDRERQNALQLHCPNVRGQFTWQDLNRPSYIWPLAGS